MDVYWLVQNVIDVPIDDEWLTETERTSLRALRIPKRRADWRLGRWTAKCAVTAYLKLHTSSSDLQPEISWRRRSRLQRRDSSRRSSSVPITTNGSTPTLSCDPESLTAIELKPAPSGAPEVFLRGQPAPLTISLSHSNGTALCAIAPGSVELGCDVESIEPRSPLFLADYFTEEEQQLVAQSPPSRRDAITTLLWSAKESALKALRCGLRADTRSLNATPVDFLHPSDREWRPITVVSTSRRTFTGWWRESHNNIHTIIGGQPFFGGQPIWLRDGNLPSHPSASSDCIDR